MPPGSGFRTWPANSACPALLGIRLPLQAIGLGTSLTSPCSGRQRIAGLLISAALAPTNAALSASMMLKIARYRPGSAT